MTKEWNYNRNGHGTAGEYHMSGWSIYCNGTEWCIDRPDGHCYQRNFKSVRTAQRFAEQQMEKNGIGLRGDLLQKTEWYDALTELLNMGFYLDRNSARDLLCSVNELIRIRNEEEN